MGNLTLEQFLEASSNISNNIMQVTLPQTQASYPMLLLKGITETEHDYFKRVDGFLFSDKGDSPDLCPLVVDVGDRNIMLGYVKMGLNTLIRLNTLQEREIFIILSGTEFQKVEDIHFTQFICQDLSMPSE